MKALLKALVRAVATACVVPLWLSFHLHALLVGKDRSLEDHTECLALWPGLSGRYLRQAFLALVLEECHPSATISFGCLFSRVGARIGPRVYIGPRCHIGLATLEEDVLLAAGVHVLSGARTHGTDDPTKPIRDQEGTLSRVRIGAGSWVGSAAVVMADIGRRSIVGAGAVVARPLPDDVVAAGVPARVVRARFPTAPVVSNTPSE
jgi:virginiamycin A acetyltransferase